jgi:hypothetical protein
MIRFNLYLQSQGAQKGSKISTGLAFGKAGAPESKSRQGEAHFGLGEQALCLSDLGDRTQLCLVAFADAKLGQLRRLELSRSVFGKGSGTLGEYSCPRIFTFQQLLSFFEPGSGGSEFCSSTRCRARLRKISEGVKVRVSPVSQFAVSG